MGVRVAHNLISPGIVDYIEMENNITILSIHVPEDWIGKSILDIDIRKKYNITVVAIKRKGEMYVNPHPDMQLASDDMLIIRGVNVFPSQIETVLLNHGYPANYQIIVGRENNTDTLDINVEMSEALFSDEIRSIEKVEKDIVTQLRSMLGIGAKVHLVNPKTIARSEGKAQRIIDNRKL